MNLNNNIPDVTKMSDAEMKDLATKLIERALKGEHTKSNFLRNFAEVSVSSALCNANKKLKNGFDVAARDAFKSYLNNKTLGIDSIDLLFAYKTYRLCEEFYGAEADYYDGLIEEFYFYFTRGHLLKTILGYDRSNEDMKKDFRPEGIDRHEFK